MKECEEFFLCCCTPKQQEVHPSDQGSQEMAATGADSNETNETEDQHPPPTDDDPGVPAHFGQEKQLHSETGFNLAVNESGHVYGTREPFTSDAILHLSADGPSEVRIKGRTAQKYIAMNSKGKVYAEDNRESENTVWLERYDDGWNSYVLKNSADKEWHLGIKKSGKLKRGHKTRAGQKACKFVPRPAYPANH